MIVCAIADLHGYLIDIPPCDLLLIAGDVAKFSDPYRQKEWLFEEFDPWLRSCEAGKIVGIAGNHDLVFGNIPLVGQALPWTYLENESCEIEGLTIWGSPYSLPFFEWAFMAEEHLLEKMWTKIPDRSDIILTHGPAYGILDRAHRGVLTGSPSLRRRSLEIAPMLHVCGHIHEAYGLDKIGDTFFANASVVDPSYALKNKPLMFEVDVEKRIESVERRS